MYQHELCESQLHKKQYMLSIHALNTINQWDEQATVCPFFNEQELINISNASFTKICRVSIYNIY